MTLCPTTLSFVFVILEARDIQNRDSIVNAIIILHRHSSTAGEDLNCFHTHRATHNLLSKCKRFEKNLQSTRSFESQQRHVTLFLSSQGAEVEDGELSEAGVDRQVFIQSGMSEEE